MITPFAHRRPRVPRPRPARRQRGAFLIEGLIAIAIFSIGITGILALVGKMIVASSDSQYRVQAAQFAASMISEMRGADPATRTTAYTLGGTSYATWNARIAGALPLVGTNTSIVPLSVSFPSSDVVEVTIKWRAPQDTSDNTSSHSYVTTTSFN